MKCDVEALHDPQKIAGKISGMISKTRRFMSLKTQAGRVSGAAAGFWRGEFTELGHSGQCDAD